MVKREQKGGAISLLILVISALLAILYFGLIHVSKSSIEVSNQKQLLDNAGSLIGYNIIKYGLNHVCVNGSVQNETRIILLNVAREMNINPIPDIRCDDLGIYTDDLGQTKRKINISTTTSVSSHYNHDTTTRSITSLIKEQSAQIKKPDSSITFILDFSGSMNSFNRRNQLINAFNQFIDGNYDIKYGVVLFSTDVIQPSININKGNIHDADSKIRVSRQIANGSTNFTSALTDAKRLLFNQPIDKHFFVFITDGDPTAGGEPISWVRQNIFNVNAIDCKKINPDRNCITIYSLGINVSDANVERLIKMSGNAATADADRDDYFFYASNDQIRNAFDNIIASIMCKWGPISPIPSVDELSNLNVFLNDIPVNRNDWELDDDTYEIKIYNATCDSILEGGGIMTVRYGRPAIITPESI
jgi:hypothetical protein